MKRIAFALGLTCLASAAQAQLPDPAFKPTWDNRGNLTRVPHFTGETNKFLRSDGVYADISTVDAPSGAIGTIQYNCGGVFCGTPLPVGMLKGAFGPSFTTAVAGTDYLAPGGNGSGLIGLLASQIGGVPGGVLKGSAGGFASAVAGTDYVAPGASNTTWNSPMFLQGASSPAFIFNATGNTSGNRVLLLSEDTSGNLVFSSAADDISSSVIRFIVARAGLSAGIQKSSGGNSLVAATAGTDYVAPGGSAGAIDVTTQAVDNNTTKAASTAYVQGQKGTATPAMDGSGAAGTSPRWAPIDHVHPTDTTRTPTTRTITAGTGLTGGGDLSADRTIALSTPVSVANGGTNYTGGAWSSSALTPSSGSGSFTSATASITQLIVGKLVHFRLTVTITTNGTAATDVRVTLPTAPKATPAFIGNEGAITHGMLFAYVFSSASSLLIITTNSGTYPGADGRVFDIEGSYEAA